MKRIWGLLATIVLAVSSPARAENVTVSIDASAATAVLEAVRNPRLTVDEALKIARLPGNQGLIRKAKGYGRPATDALFAQALVAAAHDDTAFDDVGRFRFDLVRAHATQIEPALAALGDPKLHLVDGVRARIALFTPEHLKGAVRGYLVVGGTSGGFAFGQPEFFLNLDYCPSATLASTIMEHELFHAIQGLARPAQAVTPGVAACLAKTPHAEDIANLFGSLSNEGSASYVGDVLALPKAGADEATTKDRARVARNVGMVHRSITQLELSVHGLATGAAVTPADVYELGFYGDEVLYALGYVMARAIAQEEGNAALGALIARPGSEFVLRYVQLRAYGKSDAAPILNPATIAWARQVSACQAAT